MRHLLIALVPTALAGCIGPGPRVVTQVNSYRTPDFLADYLRADRPTIRVQSPIEDSNSTLEFADFKRKLEQRLLGAGFKTTDSPDAEYVPS
jgi:hypothetical protein